MITVPLWAIPAVLVIVYALGFLTPLALALALLKKAVKG